MGAALARAMQKAGHTLTVWNRSPEKLAPFVADGVSAAPDIASAIAASPVVLICIDNYASTRAMLDTEAVAPLLNGRTVVQLSTGTPKEAHEAAGWMAGLGAAYLDGAILCSPVAIGTRNAQILLSGDTAAQERAGGMLECLGGTVRYLGPNPGAASALDLAWLTIWLSQFLAIAHAANMCRAEDAGLEDFISLFPGYPFVQNSAAIVRDGRFGDYTASLQVWGEALQRIRQQGADAGISTEVPDHIAGFFGDAVGAGYGRENVMALYKVLRDRTRP